MPRLDDANVADEYGPDRFMPREVDEGAAEAVIIRETDERIVTGAALEELVEILCETDAPADVVAYDWYARQPDTRQHDAEVAAKALEEAARVLDKYDGQIAVATVQEALTDRAARIRREAGAS